MDLVDTLIKSVAAVYSRTMSREGNGDAPIQSGAIPWRLAKRKKLEVLLVTGRRSKKRWMIPKGWPVDGKSMPDSAAQEAFEEAGIKGKVDPTPIGTFRHTKQHLLMGTLEVEIVVYPMAVDRELDNWPERDERTRKWFALSDAADRVDSDALKALILEFGKSMKPKASKKAAAAA